MAKKWKTSLTALLMAGIALCASAEEGVTDSTILIGQTIGVTGDIAGPVKEMTEGANAYIKFINSQGGVNGRRIEIRIMDDKFDPKLAAANAENLIKKQHVFALFQCRGTPHTQAILPLMETNQVPLVAPMTGAAGFHKPVNHLLFNVRPQYQTEVRKIVEHLATVGTKEIGFLHVDDTFGQDALQGFIKAMAIRQLKPTIIAKFDRVKPDFQATAEKIITAYPRALIIVASAKNTMETIKAIRASGSQMQLVTLSNNSSQSFVKGLGPTGVGVIISQVTPAPDMLTSLLGQQFKKIAEANKTTMSYSAMEGFVSAKVLVEGLRRAGPNLTRKKFVQAMETMQGVDLGGMTISYSDQDHSGSEFVELTMIGRNGQFVR